MPRNALLLILVLVVSSAAIAAGVQKWVDKDGKTHYGAKPPQDVRSQSVDTSLTVSDSQSSERVYLYATSWCGYCRKARSYLTANNISYTEYDIDNDRLARAKYDQLGGNGIPLLVKGDQRITGFTKRRYDHLFKN